MNKEFIEMARVGFERFYTENGRYPISVEIDSCEYLPSSKTIQRRIGSVSKLREILGLEITDYTKGKYRSSKASVATEKSEETQNDIYKILIAKFGKMSVHREEPYADNSRERSDFQLYHKKGHIWIDAFHPGVQKSFFTCVNFKIRKYGKHYFGGKIIFLNTNPEINCDLSTKKIKLKRNQQVMDLIQFYQFIDTLRPIEIKD